MYSVHILKTLENGPNESSELRLSYGVEWYIVRFHSLNELRSDKEGLLGVFYFALEISNLLPDKLVLKSINP